MMDLGLMNEWLDANLRLKNVEALIEKYPGDASLKIELQNLKQNESKLKVKIDSFKQKQEEVQQTRDDCEGIEW